jgi:hypothetical protein
MEQLESLYHPSPLEQAYARHLLATVFPSSIVLNSSSSTNASLRHPDNWNEFAAPAPSIRIAGREAVPFLSQSGLDRTVLRHIWSTVDPNATGKLSTLHQFYVVLRLVALAQTGLLWTPQNSDIDATAVSMQIQQCLVQTAHRTDVKLATFAGVTIPDKQVLQTMYAPIHHHQFNNQDENYSTRSMFSQPADAVVPTTSPAFETAVASTGAWNALDTLSSANLSNVAPLASPFTNVGLVTVVTSAAMEPALGTLNSFSGAPFNMAGTINVNPAAGRTAVDDDNEASDNFGDFETAPVQVTTGDWDALDGLATVPDAPLPTLSPAPMTQPVSGDLAGQSAMSFALADPLFNANQTTDSMGQSTIPLAANSDPANVGNVDHDDSEGFGDFSTAPINVTSGAWDALDELATVQDAPLPTLAPAPLPSTYSGAVAAAAATAMPPAMISAVHDSFLESTKEVKALDNDGFGDFSNAPLPVTSDVGWGALDELDAVQDAPLPNLAANGQPTTEAMSDVAGQGNSVPENVDQDDSEGFGDFSAGPVQVTSGAWGALDELADVQDAPLPTLAPAPWPQTASGDVAAQLAPSDIAPDPFSSKVATNSFGQSTLPLAAVSDLGNVRNNDEDDSEGFGDFSTAPIQVMSGAWDALDELAAVQDAPLPTLAPAALPQTAHNEVDGQSGESFPLSDPFSVEKATTGAIGQGTAPLAVDYDLGIVRSNDEDDGEGFGDFSTAPLQVPSGA